MSAVRDVWRISIEVGSGAYLVIDISPALSTVVVVPPRPWPKRLADLAIHLPVNEGAAQDEHRMGFQFSLSPEALGEVVRPMPQ